MWMRTFPTRISRDRKRLPATRAGFTLLELLMVLALLTLSLVMVTPNFFSMLESEREREVSRLIRVMRLARNEAVLTGRRQRMWFDLKQNAYAFEKEVDGVFEAYQRPRLMRAHQLPESLVIVDLMLVGSGSERIRSRRVPILIDHSGYMDPFMLHMRQGEEFFTIRANGLSGRFDVVPGDVTELRN